MRFVLEKNDWQGTVRRLVHEACQVRLFQITRLLSANRTVVSAQARSASKRLFCHVNQTRVNTYRLLLHIFHRSTYYSFDCIREKYFVWFEVAYYASAR